MFKLCYPYLKNGIDQPYFTYIGFKDFGLQTQSLDIHMTSLDVN